MVKFLLLVSSFVMFTFAPGAPSGSGFQEPAPGAAATPPAASSTVKNPVKATAE